MHRCSLPGTGSGCPKLDVSPCACRCSMRLHNRSRARPALPLTSSHGSCTHGQCRPGCSTYHAIPNPPSPSATARAQRWAAGRGCRRTQHQSWTANQATQGRRCLLIAWHSRGATQAGSQRVSGVQSRGSKAASTWPRCKAAASWPAGTLQHCLALALRIANALEPEP